MLVDEKDMLPSSSSQSEEEEDQTKLIKAENEELTKKIEASSLVDQISDLNVTAEDNQEISNKSVGAITSTPDRTLTSPRNIFSPLSGLYFFKRKKTYAILTLQFNFYFNFSA